MSTWMTRANEPVSEGDLVALSVLRYADAVGRIVAEGDDRRLQCVLVRGHCKAGTVVNVEPDQLLVRVFS